MLHVRNEYLACWWARSPRICPWKMEKASYHFNLFPARMAKYSKTELLVSYPFPTSWETQGLRTRLHNPGVSPAPPHRPPSPRLGAASCTPPLPQPLSENNSQNRKNTIVTQIDSEHVKVLFNSLIRELLGWQIWLKEDMQTGILYGQRKERMTKWEG